MITLVFVVPLLSWILVARRDLVGWVVGALLGVCVVAETALAKRWIVTDAARFTLLVAFVLLTVVALVVGIGLETRRRGVRRLRSVGGRAAAGLVVSGVYCVISLCGALLFVFIVTMNGGAPAVTPSAADVLPLPAGLVVVGNRDAGCYSGSSTYCTREIQVRSATGLSDEEVTQQLVHHLSQAHGWDITPDEHGDLGACRNEGWFLDRREVCVGVSTVQGRVTVEIETGDSW